MRRFISVLLLCACLLTLSGCSEYDQIENLAYVVILGMDLTENGEFLLSAVIPKISGSRGGDSSGGSESSSQLVYSASGSDFADALSMLRWAVPRRLELSQIELIVVSEDLASDNRFIEAAPAMIHNLYGAARLAICSGKASDFVAAEKPQIGSQTQSELTAMFEDYTHSGYIPDATFADFFYKTASFYSDPIAIYAEPSRNAQTASVVIPDNPGASASDSQQANRYLGAAVFRNGKFVGRLSGKELLCCRLLRGDDLAFPYALDDKSFELAVLGVPRIIIDTEAQPVKITVRMTFSILPGSDFTSNELLSQSLEEDLRDAVNACKAIGAEPFEFAEVAARSFLTIADWQAYGWREKFADSEIRFKIKLNSERS